MKKLIPLACAILIVVLSGCPQDTEVEPTPQETVLIDVGDTAPSFDQAAIT